MIRNYIKVDKDVAARQLEAAWIATDFDWPIVQLTFPHSSPIFIFFLFMMLCPDSLPHWPLCKRRRLLSSHISATHSSGNYLANRCFKNTGTGKISSGKWVISGMFIHPSLETPKVVFGAGGKGATRDGLCFTRCYLLYLQVLLLYIQVLLIYLQVLLHIQVLPTLPPSATTLPSNGTYTSTSKVMSGVPRSCKENVGTYMGGYTLVIQHVE